MTRYSPGRVSAIAVISAFLSGGLTCTPLPPFAGPLVADVLGMRTHSREAQGGGYVTVEVGVLPGPLPDTNIVGPATTVAWFSNAGEGGKREKRYGWKPRAEAEYDLVLSNDGSGRTKWTMNEINRATLARTLVHSGHLWVCDPEDHSAAGRAVAFKDCPRSIAYDSTWLGSSQQIRRMISFANNAEAVSENEDRTLESSPIWISCTSGCCTLGR